MIKFTFYPINKKLFPNIETLEFKNIDKFKQHIEVFSLNFNYEENVYCCFHNNRGNEGSECRNDQWSLLITHDYGELNLFIENQIFEHNDFLDLALLEFENYKDALEYCIDLKEGF